MTLHTDSQYLRDAAEKARSGVSEAQHRASNVTMLDVIRREVKPHTKPCPWCASDPLPAKFVIDRYVVGCENDDCFVQPQVSGSTMTEAWARWDSRI